MKLIFTVFPVLIYLGVACSAPSGSPAGVDTALLGTNNKTGKYLQTRGVKIYYEQYGSGQPLLMLHANNGSINNFKYQVPPFAQHYRVILPDSRAQGRSVDNSDTLSYEMMADDFNALLDSLQLDSCLVLGWSDGGIEGLLLAMRHPDKVRKLAITGANLWPDTTAIEPFLYQMISEYHDSLFSVPQTPLVKHKLKLSMLLSEAPNITPEQLKQVQCPVLVMAGDHDIIRPQHTLLIAENIARSNLWIIPNSGHTPLWFQKDIFNEGVKRFFDQPFRDIQGWDQFD